MDSRVSVFPFCTIETQYFSTLDRVHDRALKAGTPFLPFGAPTRPVGLVLMGANTEFPVDPVAPRILGGLGFHDWSLRRLDCLGLLSKCEGVLGWAVPSLGGGGGVGGEGLMDMLPGLWVLELDLGGHILPV